MRFYEFEGCIDKNAWILDRSSDEAVQDNVEKIANITNLFNEKNQNKEYCFLAGITKKYLTAGILCNEETDPEKQMEEYMDALDVKAGEWSVEEVTLNRIVRRLQMAEKPGYIENDYNVLFDLDLVNLCDSYSGRGTFDYDECMIEKKSKENVYKEAKKILAEDTVLPELDRIYTGRARNRIKRHPIHYMIQADDKRVYEKMRNVLLQALYANGRIQNRRYWERTVLLNCHFSHSKYNNFYRCSIGGAVILRFKAQETEENDCADCGDIVIKEACQLIKKYHNQVLTILVFPRECARMKARFYEYLGTVSVVELKENLVSESRAAEFLKITAREQHIRPDKGLFAKLDSKRGYYTAELYTLFEEWYDHKLKTSVYPQYKEIVTANHEAMRAAPKGSAYDELMEMTGLTEAKKVIRQALDYYKAQKLFAEKGMKEERASMHMIFTGNPGTAKTTVSRLFARIMRENNILSRGVLVEAGRGDLVGRYVGWTAPLIQEKFKQAEGGVLFIDEAYSLVDDRNGSYGDEAINTIVQEMENHRDDVVVIFAGYQDKMEGFLDKNPGLRSRIAFHVPFEDYNAEELCEIAELFVKKNGMCFADGAVDKLRGLFAEARKEKNFGNGRYVRNVVEQAKMAQASRLLKKEWDEITQGDITTLCAEDIHMPSAVKKNSKIGFVA